jgi:hypothetical protein
MLLGRTIEEEKEGNVPSEPSITEKSAPPVDGTSAQVITEKILSSSVTASAAVVAGVAMASVGA